MVGWGVDKSGMSTYRIEQRTTPGGLSNYRKDWRTMSQAYVMHDGDEVCRKTIGISWEDAYNLAAQLNFGCGMGTWEYRIVECCEACGR